MATYHRKPQSVDAIQWTGSNFTDIEAFFTALGHDLTEIGLRCTDDDDRYDDVEPIPGLDEAEANPHLIQFYLDNNDQEVEIGYWIVIDYPDYVYILDKDTFTATYSTPANEWIVIHDTGHRETVDDVEFRSTYTPTDKETM